MTKMGENVRDVESNGKSDMDMEMIWWLDSVHQLLCLRDSLSQVLRQVRYAIGPTRISQPLYSLKPYAASASVLVKSSPSSGAPETADDQEDVFLSTNSCALHFTLHKQSSDGDDQAPNQPLKNTLKSRNPQGSSKSGQPVQRVPSDWSQEEDIAYKMLMGDTDDSDTETDTELQSMTSTQAMGSSKPLHWFGGLVSPHLRAAQRSFDSALEILVDIANAQSDAGQGHGDVKIHEYGEGPQHQSSTQNTD